MSGEINVGSELSGELKGLNQAFQLWVARAVQFLVYWE